jgi:hypothetical protein
MFNFQRFVSKPEGDADLIQQLEIYEHQLKQEDGEPYVNLDYSNQHRWNSGKNWIENKSFDHLFSEK